MYIPPRAAGGCPPWAPNRAHQLNFDQAHEMRPTHMQPAKEANRSEAVGLCVSRRLERRRVDSSTCPRASAATLVSIVDVDWRMLLRGDDGGGVMTAGRISRLRASDVDEMSIIMRKKNARAREAIELGCVHGQEAADAFDSRFLRRRRGAPSGV